MAESTVARLPFVIGRAIYANSDLAVLRIALEVKVKDRVIARSQAQASVLRRKSAA